MDQQLFVTKFYLYESFEISIRKAKNMYIYFTVYLI